MTVTEIKNRLPHGAIKDIAERIGVTPGTVQNALKSEKRKNKRHLSVINTAIEYLNECKTLEKEADQKLNELI